MFISCGFLGKNIKKEKTVDKEVLYFDDKGNVCMAQDDYIMLMIEAKRGVECRKEN